MEPNLDEENNIQKLDKNKLHADAGKWETAGNQGILDKNH